MAKIFTFTRVNGYKCAVAVDRVDSVVGLDSGRATVKLKEGPELKAERYDEVCAGLKLAGAKQFFEVSCPEGTRDFYNADEVRWLEYRDDEGHSVVATARYEGPAEGDVIREFAEALERREL